MVWLFCFWLELAMNKDEPMEPLNRESINIKSRIDETHLNDSSFKLKRSKSFYTPGKCSTPKLCLSKELEFLNILYNEGSLNDSQMELATKDDNALKSVDNKMVAEAYNVSPIVTNLSQSILKIKKNLPPQSPLSLVSTPAHDTIDSQTKKCVTFENLNRNLEFDDENSNQGDNKVTAAHRLETVNEKEEVLEETITTDFMAVGFRTATGRKLNVKRDSLVLMQEKIFSTDEANQTKVNFKSYFRNAVRNL